MTVKLSFSSYAWNKLQYMCHAGGTEVAAFGVCPNSPMHVEDIRLLPQTCGVASFEFDKDGLADYMDELADKKLDPNKHLRIWIHTHPGNSATPSGTDRATLNSEFGKYPWVVMYILARDGAQSAEMRLLPHDQAACVVGSLTVTVETSVKWTDTKTPFGDKTYDQLVEMWKKEYDDNVSTKSYGGPYNGYGYGSVGHQWESWHHHHGTQPYNHQPSQVYSGTLRHRDNDYRYDNDYLKGTGRYPDIDKNKDNSTSTGSKQLLGFGIDETTGQIHQSTSIPVDPDQIDEEDWQLRFKTRRSYDTDVIPSRSVSNYTNVPKQISVSHQRLDQMADNFTGFAEVDDRLDEEELAKLDRIHSAGGWLHD